MKRNITSGITLSLLLLSILAFAFNIQSVRSDWTWTETIYIRADGSVEPDTAPISSVDNITYTLTDNIVGDILGGSNAIVVERNNTVVDGAGYTLQGTGSGTGIALELGGSNVTIKNVEIKSFFNGIHACMHACTVTGNNIKNNTVNGIYLYESSSNTISRNNVTNNAVGISIDESSNNTITGNNITANSGDGIRTDWYSNFNTISGNTMTNNEYGIMLLASSGNIIYHNNFMDNTQQVNASAIGIYDCINTWDDGYPSGGNYWGDHACTGNPSDGSQPYIIDTNNTDNYPFQDPNGWLVPGDTNGDEIVNIEDIIIAALAFGSYSGHPKWNPQADLNNDGLIDIFDLVIIGVNFGKKLPL